MKVANARIVFFLAVLLWIPATARPQTISFGLNAGIPLSGLIETSDGETATTGPYTFGPSIRIRLPRGFSLDAGLLYKRFAFGLTSNPERAAVQRLELPVLLRHDLSGSPIHPWVHAGISFNRVIAVGADVCARNSLGELTYCIAGETAAELRHRHTHGPALGAGFEFKWAGFRVAPEMRLTRWVDRNFGTRDSALRSHLTQVEVLLGLQF
ncbi:MAG TPA: hypothetical protein VE398_23575 [Acidobacteriota bacterium]|nr:hypothetical protein [Acidobacteriota bacterium]